MQTNCQALKTKGAQTEYPFYTLADLPGSDSLYEEIESGSSFIDDVIQSPRSDDAFWNEKLIIQFDYHALVEPEGNPKKKFLREVSKVQLLGA